MFKAKMKLAVLVLVLLVLPDSNAFWFLKPKPRPGKPYYFGTQDLLCKRGAPSRFPWAISHRLIKYDGYVIDYGGSSKKNAKGKVRKVNEVSGCKLKWESKPADYSTVSIDCIKKCVKNWKNKYWDLEKEYHLLWRNCHRFANLISKILYDNVDCPSWCN